MWGGGESCLLIILRVNFFLGFIVWILICLKIIIYLYVVKKFFLCVHDKSTKTWIIWQSVQNLGHFSGKLASTYMDFLNYCLVWFYSFWNFGNPYNLNWWQYTKASILRKVNATNSIHMLIFWSMHLCMIYFINK